MARSMYTAPRAPYDGLRPAFDALVRKKDASLSGGAFARDPRPGVSTIIHARNRSRFAATLAGVDAGDGALGMGIVQAVLAALTGAVRAMTWDADGRRGHVTIDGIGSAETYQMSWDDQRPDYLLLGGFVNGATYQAALVGLVVLWTQREVAPDRTAEVIERWWTLLQEMDARYARPDRTSGWDTSQVKAACQDAPKNAAIRDAIEALADALAFALRYALPALDERGLYVQYAACATTSAFPHASASGAALVTLPTDTGSVDRTAMPSTDSDAAFPPVTVDDATDDDLDLDCVGDGSDPVSEAADGRSEAEDSERAAEPTPLAGTERSGDPSVEPASTSSEEPLSATTDSPATEVPASATKRTRRPKTTADAASIRGRSNAASASVALPPLPDVPLVGTSVQTRIARAFALRRDGNGKDDLGQACRHRPRLRSGDRGFQARPEGRDAVRHLDPGPRWSLGLAGWSDRTRSTTCCERRAHRAAAGRITTR